MQTAYVIHPARAIHHDITLAPDVGGLYAFMLKDPASLADPLQRAGLVMDVMGLGQKPLLYIGASGDSLRGRIRCHLRDDTQNSTFRMSLGALLADKLDLKVKPIPYRGVFGFVRADEARLTAWMCAHLDIGVLPASRPIELERRHIRQHDPVLNITGRRAYDSAWTVLLLRRRCIDQTFAGAAPAQIAGLAALQNGAGA